VRRLAVLGVSIAIVAAIVTAILTGGGRQTGPGAPVAGSPGTQDFARGLTLVSAQSGPQRRQQVASRIAGLRLMNYYPAANGWTRMWTNWDPAVLKHDFALIRSLGANAVRIDVFPNTFGWPGISGRMATRFADTLSIAASAGLGVQLTLFDWWASYYDIAQSRAWLKAFLRPYSSDPEIQLVEIKNEVNPSDPTEVAWVRALLPTLRAVMPRTPSTVSVSGTEGPPGYVQLRRELAGSPLDVADIHFYGDEGMAYSWMLAAKRAAGSLPLFVGEIGFPAIGDGAGGPEAADLAQAHWFSVVFAAARAAGVSTPAPWTLYDFKPGAIPERGQSPRAYARAYDYGLYSATGQWRPSVSVVKQAFAQDADTSNISNLSLSLGGVNNMMVWTPYLPGQGRLAYDPDVGYPLPGSVRLSGTRLSRAGAPSFYLVPANPAISGQLWNVSVWAKGINVNGAAQLALFWFGSNGSYIGGTISRPLPRGNPLWTKLAVHTRAPSNATSVELDLMSYGVAGTVWFADVHIKVTP
jgi:Cellulase (glycosyl hydrolase family 5)